MINIWVHEEPCLLPSEVLVVGLLSANCPSLESDVLFMVTWSPGAVAHAFLPTQDTLLSVSWWMGRCTEPGAVAPSASPLSKRTPVLPESSDPS